MAMEIKVHIVHVLLLMLCSVTAGIIAQDTGIENVFFSQEVASNIPEKLSLGCATLLPSTKGRIECAALCSKNVNCIGVSVDLDSQCFQHDKCPGLSSVGRVNPSGHRYWIKSDRRRPCHHDGEWREDRNRCDCKHGWTGDYCDVMAKKCQDLRADGYGTGFPFANLDIHDDAQSAVWVVCRVIESSAYTYVVVSNNIGREAYNKTYNEYVEGFGSSLNEMWLGLETMYQLYQVGYDRISVDVIVNENGMTAIVKGRSEVSVTKTTSGLYSLTVHSEYSFVSGDDIGLQLGDCFKTLQGVPFSAWDFDHDGDAEKNCAAITGNGWWFSGCDVTCNPLGGRFVSGTTSSAGSVMRLPGIDVEALGLTQVTVKVFLPVP